MKKITAVLLTLAIAASAVPGMALADEEIAGNETANDRIAAFPGAEGGGMYTSGARGALESGTGIEVYHVTNLNDSGEGSFRDAVSQGNRIVVFDVSGMIELKTRVSISHSNITVLGQTAPGDGICFRGNSIKVNGKNIILRYLRCRVGSHMTDGSETETQDGFGIPIGAERVILDHCSIGWGTDENLSVVAAKDVTIQRCIVSEALNSSIHVKGEHSYAGIWGGVNVSFHHNIIASHKSRNPKIGTSETVSMTPGYTDDETVVDMWNNVIYNWGDKSGYGAENGANVNIVNNYYKPGPATPDGKRSRIFELSPGNKYQENWSGDIYADGNYIDDDTEEAAVVNAENWQIERKTGVYLNDQVTDKYTRLERLPDDSYLFGKEVETAQDAYADVIADCGANLPKTDLVDERVIENIANRTAPAEGTHGSQYLIDEPIDAVPEGDEAFYDEFGYPLWESETRPADFDTDGDGIPDAWEDKMGLDKSNPYDSLNAGPGGYTWLEIYGEDLISPVTSDEKIIMPEDYDGSGTAAMLVNTDGAQRVEFYDGGALIAQAEETSVSGISDGDTVIAAGYTNGALTDIKAVEYSEGVEIPKAEGDETRLYIWESFETMKPIDGVFFGFEASTELSGGINALSAKLYYADGTYSITPMTLAVTKTEQQQDADVSENFDVVGTIEKVSNLVINGYKGIYADNFAVLCGYNNEAQRVIRYGKIDGGVPSEKDDKGYKYIKISVRDGHVDLYAAATLSNWIKLSENGYDYKSVQSKAGTYMIKPEGKEFDASVPWRVITEQTQPEIRINNINSNDRIGYNALINVTAVAESGSMINEIDVLLNGETVKTVTDLEIDENGRTIDIPIEFSNAAAGELTVMCFDNNLCYDLESVNVYVSGDLTPWQVADIGAGENDVKLYSSITDDYTYKLNTCDGAIGGTSDKFGYMYQSFDKDTNIYARLRAQDGKQIGFVLRNDLEPDGAAYYIGCDMTDGVREYKIAARESAGAEMETLRVLDISGDKAYLIVEKKGSDINIYETENSSTVYRTKKLLYTIENSVLGETYLMGFGAVCGEDTASAPDAGWVSINGVPDQPESYYWDMDHGLDWCWQMQEPGVLKPTWSTETVSGNGTGKMVISTGDEYTSERYIFREYSMSDKYMPEITADIMLTGETPGMNMYLQTGDSSTAYKLVFSGDKTICDANGDVLGEWASDGFYSVRMTAYIDPDVKQELCKVNVESPDGEPVLTDVVIPTDRMFRIQQNTEKKTTVTNAVYFEPAADMTGTYYVDNVSVNAVECEYKISRVENTYTFDSEENYSGIAIDGAAVDPSKSKTIGGTRFTGAVRLDKSSKTITIPVTGDTEVTIYACSANSSEERPLLFTDTSGASQEISFLEPAAKTISYAGEAGNIVLSGIKGVDIYGIKTVSVSVTPNV